MTRRKKITITTIILLIVAVVFWLIWALLNRKSIAPVSTVTPSTPTAAGVSAPETVPVPRVAPLTAVSTTGEGATLSPVSFTALSRSFAERYGSYSNQSDFSNIKELYPFMTATLRATMRELIKDDPTTAAAAEGYVGVTTRAIGVRIISSSAARAEVLVETKRSESGQGRQDRVYYQNLKLNLVAEAGQWKVDDAQWE